MFNGMFKTKELDRFVLLVVHITPPDTDLHFYVRWIDFYDIQEKKLMHVTQEIE